ncbi:hypothetical protein ES708_05024 [subsurface metagenome]
MYYPLECPNPDFQLFVDVLSGKRKPNRIHLVELGYDREVIQNIYERTTNEPFLYMEAEAIRTESMRKFYEGEPVIPLRDEAEKTYYRQFINFYYRMGYDYVPDTQPWRYFKSMMRPAVRTAEDTANLPRKAGYTDVADKAGNREWVEEGKGIITSWKDFERFPWDRMVLDLEHHHRLLQESTPSGMRVMIVGSLFEHVTEQLLGFEGLAYLLYDDPELVKAVVDGYAAILDRFYTQVIDWDCIGGIFHVDDFGHLTGTHVSPEILRELFFPHLARFASLTHNHGKVFWLHSCGNHSEIMEDFIETVKIDAFHSFQDTIMPVGEFAKHYQGRIGVLGGVDVDKLCRLDEDSLRGYVRGILKTCVPGGRYALGSGNSIANYVPVDNVFIMLEEGRRYEF